MAAVGTAFGCSQLSGLQPSPAVVMDCGTGYAKLGFSGNREPSFVIPTVVGSSQLAQTGKSALLSDLDYFIGDDALSRAPTTALTYPVRHGVVEDWNCMECFWLKAVAEYLRIDSREHAFVLTEPPGNTPENRELTAEIMFESFGVPGLHIGMQAVLALYASFAAAEKASTAKQQLTGTVIDIGDGMTHVIPVCDGYVIASNIKTLPVAGRDITQFVQQLMRDRGEPVPAEVSLEVARQVKEQHSYLASDVVKEFGRHDAQPEKFVKQFSGTDHMGRRFTCDVAHERFLGPELFFSPDMFVRGCTTSLPQVVDDVIQGCPIDTRRALYGNIVLSGGSTMFRDLGRRVQRDMTRHLASQMKGAGSRPEICVRSHKMQRHAVWSGGSLLASLPEFGTICHTKAQYEEHGPSICRANVVTREVAG